MRRRIVIGEDDANSADAGSVEPYSDEEWEYEPEEQGEQPVGMLGTRGRAVALIGSLVAVVAVLATFAWLLSSRAGEQRTVNAAITGTSSAPTTGSLAPDFTLTDVHTNKPVKLSSLRGKPVFMNFWGTWCPPCRGEMPEMQKLYDKYKDQIQVVGVSMGPRDTSSQVKSFVDQQKYSWTFIHDADYSVATTYEVQAVPSSYFIDKDGIIRAVQIGGMSGDLMEHYFQQVK
ncbi:MAG: TlpA family protein disulfide reductase [Chloroflexota bacterium]|nr:TlpA family protein disulfide reductase [Chloroflexota bacterium]